MDKAEYGNSFLVCLSKSPNAATLDMQWIKPGQFVMGCSEGSPHYIKGVNSEFLVRFSHGFWISRFPVTVKQWADVLGVKLNFAFWRANKPKVNVTWFDAMAFCRRIAENHAMNLPENYMFRLPTEAEWEYSLRESALRIQPKLDDVAWHSQNTLWLRDVGMKQPTAWNLFDMQGNITEWCYDSAGYNRPSGLVTNYVSHYSQDTKHVRGGAFVHTPNDFMFSECTGDSYDVNTKRPWLGFRVCLGINYGL